MQRKCCARCNAAAGHRRAAIRPAALLVKPDSDTVRAGQRCPELPGNEVARPDRGRVTKLSRLIYPIYTLFRNKLPRPAGQGASRQVRGLVGVSGSQTGGQGVINIAQSELISGSLAGTSWPNNLPASGKQTQYALNIPYRFFGLSESLSWLAQFMGQGQLSRPPRMATCG